MGGQGSMMQPSSKRSNRQASVAQFAEEDTTRFDRKVSEHTEPHSYRSVVLAKEGPTLLGKVSSL